MITLPTSLNNEIRKIASSGSILTLIEIPCTINSVNLDIRIVKNLADVTWNGHVWTKSWFEIDTIDETSTGNPPELSVSISNIGGLVEDQLILRNNLDGCECTIYFISSITTLTDYNTPIFSVTFNVMKVKCSRDIATVKLSVQNPMLLNCPSFQLHGTICQYPKFSNSVLTPDPRCPYVGAYTTCNRTLSDCLLRWPGGLLPFGGQLGLLGELQDDSDL